MLYLPNTDNRTYVSFEQINTCIVFVLCLGLIRDRNHDCLYMKHNKKTVFMITVLVYLYKMEIYQASKPKNTLIWHTKVGSWQWTCPAHVMGHLANLATCPSKQNKFGGS